MLHRLAFALLLLSPALASAFSSTPSGNQTTFSGFTAGSGNIGRYAVSTASDGTVLVSSGARMAVAGGGSIPINVTGGIARPSAAAAVGRFLRKVGPLGNAAAVVALAVELGYALSDDPAGGAPVVTKPTQVDSTYNDGFEYAYGGVWSHSALSACARWVAEGSGGQFAWSAPTFTAPTTCRANRTTISTGGTFPQTVTISRRSQLSAPPPPPILPSTAGELENAIATKSGWPSDSTLGNAIRDIISSGDALAVENPVVTGPASAPVSTTTRVDPATGVTTTTVVTVSNTYSGPTVTTTTTTTETKTDTATGAPIGTPTTTTTAAPVTTTPTTPEEAPTLTFPCGIAGTPPCKVDIDESETPAEVDEDEFKPLLDEGKQAQEDLLEQVRGDADKSFFDGFADLFVTPPLAECVPLEIPGDRGTIDPCGTVGGARAIMAYIWALSGLALCLHMVRSAI